MDCKKGIVICVGVCLCCNIYMEGLAETPYYSEHTHENHPTSPIGKLLVAGTTATSVAISGW